MRRIALGIAALACAATLAACTSSASGGGETLAPPITVATSSAPSDTVLPTDGVSSQPATSAPASTRASTSAAPSSKAASSPSGPPACGTRALTVRVIRGGAIAGQQLAAVTFTNSSTAACSLFGYPGVSLLRKGVLLGKPADRSAVQPKNVVLKPGEQGEAQVTVFSTCNAPLSDTMRVYPPNLKTFVDNAIELRGCRMAVDPVTHS